MVSHLWVHATPTTMSADDFRKAVGDRGMSLRDAARFLGVNERTVRSWVGGDNRIPLMAVKLLLTMPATEESLTPFDKALTANKDDAPPVTQEDFSVRVLPPRHRDKVAANRIRYRHPANKLPIWVRSQERMDFDRHCAERWARQVQAKGVTAATYQLVSGNELP